MKKLFFIFSFFLLVIIGLPQISLGIGQLTQPIIIENVLKGQEFVETLSLFNSKTIPDVYELRGGGDIAKWLSFYKTDDTNFKNPITKIDVQPKSYQDVTMRINVPIDAPNGKYVGEAIARSIPVSKNSIGTTSVAIRQKVGREISITVTDKEIIDLHARIIPEFYDIKKGQPLNIKINYDNEGNISLKPSVSLKIINTINNSAVFDAVFVYPGNQEPIAAKTTKTIPIKWQSAGQEKARYEAQIKIMVNQDVVAKDSFRFNLGLSQNKALSLVAKIGNDNLGFGWLIIGIVLLIIAAILIVIKRKIKK